MRIFRRTTNRKSAAILILLLIVVGYFLFNNLKKASAEWLDSSWFYRKAIKVPSHTTSENNVYVTVPAFDATDTAKFQSDCGDLRFTKQNGQLLSYYVVDCDATANIHVQFDTLPAGASTYYMYYGNPSAPNGFESADFAIAASGLGSQTLATEEKGPAPVAYWKFDEGQGTTTYDDSTNNNDGTLSGGTLPTWTLESQCVSGKCLSFPGGTSGTVTVANTVAGVQTVSFWVKPATASAAMIDLNAADVSIIATTGTITAPNFTAPTIYVNGNVSSTLTANAWQFITVTTGTGISASAIKIGNYKGDYLKGFMDEVKIYPYVRTAAQIKTDYNSRNSTSGTSVKIGGESAWISNGLVGYWKMDEKSGAGSTLADSSGTGNAGTAVLWGGGNAATDSAHVAGKFGNAFSFDGGDDYLDAGTNASLSPNTFTIATWIKVSPSVLRNAGIYMRFAGGSSTNIKNALYFDNVGGNLRLSITVRDQSGNTVDYTDETTDLIDNKWHHVAAVLDSNFLRMYIDGAENATPVARTIGNIGTGGTNYIGKNTYNNVSFNGSIDEMRVYNRPLSPKEVSDLYNFAPGPVAYWKMDDKVSGDSQTIIDSSTYGNNGTTFYGANMTGMNCKAIGKYGGGCLLDGVDDYTSISNTISGIQTVSFWVKPSSTTANMLDINTSDPAYISASSGNISATGFSTPTIYVNGVSSAPLTANTWQHVTVTTATGLTGSAIAFGKANGVYLNGSIDDVRIYNYARTQKQILEDMNAGHPSVGSPVGSYAGYWKFDEGHDTTAYDNSSNANTGTITGASWNNSGKFGKTLSFNGTSNYVSTSGNPTSLQITNDLSISAWINLTTNNAVHDIVAKKGASGQFGYRLSTTTGGKLQFELSSGGANTRAATGSATLANNTWYYVTGVYSQGNSMTVYVNGVQDGQITTALPASIYNSSGNVNIGAENAGASNYFAGSIDEVKIYPFALIASDIQTEYNRSSSLILGSLSDTSGLTGGSIASNSASAAYCIPGDTATCNPPVGQWKFDEKVSGDSQTVYDTSGNGNNGTTSSANGTGMNCKIIGKYGGGCSFDGIDDYVDINAVLTSDESFTLGFWIKPNKNYLTSDSADDGKDFAIFQASSGITFLSYYGFGGGYGANAIHFQLTNDGIGQNIIRDQINLNQGTWYHIAVSWDGDKAALYVNGILIGTHSDQSTHTLTAIDMIGASSNGFNGVIDDFRVYNYARTPAQVAWDYNRGKPLAYWKFDECQGATANDSSGNGNAGTITIGVTVPQTTAGTCLTPTDGTGAWYNGLSGKFNSSISLDGVDDYVQVSDTANLRFDTATNDFSLFAWVKRTATGTEYILSKEDADDDGWRLMFNSSNQVLCSEDATDVTGTSAITDTNWHLIGCTIDRDGNGQIYIDSRSDGSAVSMGSDAMATTANIRIGTRSYTSTNYFNGQIDDVKIYNYVPTLQQIKLDYNQGAAVRFGPTTGRP